MPVYEYACSACNHEFEEWQKISDPPVKTCPKCKKRKVERLISRTSFHLKGGGWYSDLYGSAKPGSKDAGKESSSSDAGTSDSKSDSTTAVKSESKPTTTKSDPKPSAKSEKPADKSTKKEKSK